MRDFDVPDNVCDFLRKSERIIGKARADRASTVIYSECEGLESPIEQLFLIAFNTVAEANFRSVSSTEYAKPFELVITPQLKVGNYRVDFVVYQQPRDEKTPTMVAVECDGHGFHDKDKHQRSYEKKRDRDLQRAGLKVFRFTGSDIVKNPYECAAEVIAELTGEPEELIMSCISEYGEADVN